MSNKDIIESAKATEEYFNYMLERERQLQIKLDTAVKALEKKKDEVQTLWMLLDDIDTLDDAARENDAAFRKNCYEIQQKRWLIADSFSKAVLANIKE